jgi:hypothetical protein
LGFARQVPLAGTPAFFDVLNFLGAWVFQGTCVLEHLQRLYEPLDTAPLSRLRKFFAHRDSLGGRRVLSESAGIRNPESSKSPAAMEAALSC